MQLVVAGGNCADWACTHNNQFLLLTKAESRLERNLHAEWPRVTVASEEWRRSAGDSTAVESNRAIGVLQHA